VDCGVEENDCDSVVEATFGLQSTDEAAGEDPLAQAQAQAARAADDLARARADLYNLQQEYQGFVRRSREGAASHRDAGAAGVVEAPLDDPRPLLYAQQRAARGAPPRPPPRGQVLRDYLD